MIEKRSMINIALAFAISLKHYLRGEEGVYYEDLWFLVKVGLPPSLTLGGGSLADFERRHTAPSGLSDRQHHPLPPWSRT